MKIQEQDLYYGCVFSQIFNYASLTTIKKIEGQQGVYTINDESLLIIKYSSETGSQWKFILCKSELEPFKEEDLLMSVFMVFVCGFQYICVVKRSDVMRLLGKGRAKQTFVISLESTRYFHIHNRDLDLFFQMPVRAFPASIFEEFADKDDRFAWPPLCTVNVYREEPIKVFSSNDRRLDLSDLLIQNFTDSEVRVSYIGVSTKNPAWETWDEITKQKIVERIVYMFEFEGIAVDIEAVTNDTEIWCTDEFIWKIEYWREPHFSETLLEEAREIVLHYQNASISHLERHLEITYYQASCLMQALENEGIVSPIRSDGSRDMLIAKDYAGISGLLFLDDERIPPSGAILCRNADEAIALIETGIIKVISFDYDLGARKTGYDVAQRIKALVRQGLIPLPEWHIHAGSPACRKKIKAVMESAGRFAKLK